ncbi:unnamed protein product [Paramecium pentaurelia]|uniref:WD domain, G-beta repeat protein n=1 Tax=Paramecium pentaurelia TaxID=43138 RepID=A0A8S1UZ50_9CILI|nr:unnamed protein product [Paramecium pentaurelia]
MIFQFSSYIKACPSILALFFFVPTLIINNFLSYNFRKSRKFESFEKFTNRFQGQMIGDQQFIQNLIEDFELQLCLCQHYQQQPIQQKQIQIKIFCSSICTLKQLYGSPPRRENAQKNYFPKNSSVVPIQLKSLKCFKAKEILCNQLSQQNELQFPQKQLFKPKPLVQTNFPKSIRLWDVQKGQQKAKLDGHSNQVRSVCLSPDGKILASGSQDNSIRLWDLKTGQEIQSSDKNYKDIFQQFKIPLQNSSLLPNVEPDLTILRICQNLQFEARGTLILQGKFINQSGIDLKTLFKQKESYFLEDLQKK